MSSERRWTLVATIVGSSLTFVDGTVVNIALPALQADLHATIVDVQWVIEAYALLMSALILAGGSLGDQFGRKRLFLAGVVVFTAASALNGVARSTPALIIGRALQGAGAGFLVPGSLAIISAAFDDAERGRAIGTWAGFSAITSAIGPVVGGWLIEHVTWRLVFLLNLPFGAAVIALSWRFMSESRDPSRSPQVDVAGALLGAAGLGGVVFGLLEWQRLVAGEPVAIVATLVGTACLLGLPWVEHRARNPMLPLEPFRSRTFSLANVLTLLLYAALALVLFLVPLNLIQVQGYSATSAGAALLPVPLCIFALSRWIGGLTARAGSRLLLTAGPFVSALGVALYALPSVGGSYWTTFFLPAVVLGLGMAVTVAPLTTTVMESIDERHAGVASGVNNAVSRVAGLLAIALFGILLIHTFGREVGPRIDRLALAPAARTAIDDELSKMAGAELSKVPIDAGQRAAVRQAIDEAFVRSFRLVMLAAGGLALAAAGVGATIRGRADQAVTGSS